MSEATQDKGLKTARKDNARRGKLKKTRNKSTRFGIASVHRKPNTKTAETVKPAKGPVKKKATTRKVAGKKADNIAAARAVSTADSSLMTVSTPASGKSGNTGSTADTKDQCAAAPAQEHLQDSPQEIGIEAKHTNEETEKQTAPAVTAAHIARNRKRSGWRPLMISGLLAVIGLLGYRYWFSGQDSEEVTLATNTAVPVSIPHTSDVTLTAPVETAVPDTTPSVDQGAATPAPTHKWQYRPVSETDSTQAVDNIVAAATELKPPVPSANPSTPAAGSAVGSVPSQAPNYGYYPQQRTWQQPYYRQPAYPNYPHGYR